MTKIRNSQKWEQVFQQNKYNLIGGGWEYDVYALSNKLVGKIPTKEKILRGDITESDYQDLLNDYKLAQSYIPSRFLLKMSVVRCTTFPNKPPYLIVQERVSGKIVPLNQIVKLNVTPRIRGELSILFRAISKLIEGTNLVPDLFGKPVSLTSPHFTNPRYSDNIWIVDQTKIILGEVGGMSLFEKQVKEHSNKFVNLASLSQLKSNVIQYAKDVSL